MTFKTKTALLSILTILINLIAITPSASAAGSVSFPNIRLTANKNSAAANNSDAITVTAQFYLYECNNGATDDEASYCDTRGGVKGEKAYTGGGTCPDENTISVNLQTTGEGIGLSKTSICGAMGGTDTFTVKASAVGSVTITPLMSWSYNSYTKTGTPLTISFTTPPAATPAPAPKPKATPTPVPEKPAVPTIATITVEDKEVPAGEAVALTMGQPLVLSGKTVANGKVAVWVFSEPKLYETTADKDGNWSVTVKDLPEGDHHAEVEVTNPTNNQKSDRTRLLNFTVVADKKQDPVITTTAQPVVKPKSKAGLWWALGIVLVLLVAAGVFWWVKRKKRSDHTTSGSDTGLSGTSSDIPAPTNDDFSNKQ
jgi:hypothetical protein